MPGSNSLHFIFDMLEVPRLLARSRMVGYLEVLLYTTKYMTASWTQPCKIDQPCTAEIVVIL